MGAKNRQDLFELAASQLGLVSLRQLLEAGYSNNFAYERVKSREWTLIHRGWFKVGGGPMTKEQLELATLLVAGPGAALSHFTAARRHGLDVPKTTLIDVTIPENRRGSQFGSARVFRARNFDDADTVTVGAFRLTTPERTIMDVAPLLRRSPTWTKALLYSANRENPATLYSLQLVLTEKGRGRRETAVLRELLDRHTGPDRLPESVAESFFWDLTALTGTQPAAQYSLFKRHRADFAWPLHGVVVEVDSDKFHNNWAARIKDMARDRAVVLGGWATLRYAWKEIRDERPRVLREVRELLAMREPRPDALLP